MLSDQNHNQALICNADRLPEHTVFCWTWVLREGGEAQQALICCQWKIEIAAKPDLPKNCICRKNIAMFGSDMDQNLWPVET